MHIYFLLITLKSSSKQHHSFAQCEYSDLTGLNKTKFPVHLVEFLNYTIIELFELEGTFGGHLVQSSVKVGSLRKVVNVGIQVGLEYLHRRRLLSLLGLPYPVLCHSQSKEVFSHV